MQAVVAPRLLSALTHVQISCYSYVHFQECARGEIAHSGANVALRAFSLARRVSFVSLPFQMIRMSERAFLCFFVYTYI